MTIEIYREESADERSKRVLAVAGVLGTWTNGRQLKSGGWKSRAGRFQLRSMPGGGKK